MTIQEIKERTKVTEPYYFSRDTMKFFGQKLEDFKVIKESDGRYKIVAPIRFGYTEYNGYKTEHYFNPTNNKIERE